MKRLGVFLLIGSLLMGGCATQAQNGTLAGGTAGAAIGALVAKNKLLGAVIGAAGGALIGFMVGSVADTKRINEVLERGQSGIPMTWQNPDGRQVTATPQQPRLEASTGYVYRDIIIKVDGGDSVRAKAYRDVDGSWILVQ